MNLFKNEKVKNAICLGFLCSVAYLAVYYARNILGAVNPQIIEGGFYNEAQLGSISSTYFVCYAVGQLINGMIGDRIKARYMLSFGLILAGVCNFLFPLMGSQVSASSAYGMTGFFLSMIYAPMTKVVAENTEPLYATRCSLGFTFASFFGSPLAGFTAVLFTWQTVFTISSVSLAVMGCICFVTFLIFERKGIVKYGQYKPKEKFGMGSVKELLKHNIIRFSFFSIITGVIRTTVIFWFPTYLSQYLGYSSDESSMIFSIATLVICFTSFITIFVYEKIFKRNMERTILTMFSVSSVAFLLVFLVKMPIANIALLVVAIMASNGSASIVWSRYCPSLRDTGMVSSVTGYLDFLSYMAAAASSKIFANAATTIGWGNLILVWMGLMIVGALVALSFGKERLKIKKIESAN
ncbi:MAG: MFS transporter [Ruminococcaceae bacterium]|nr:MFS transporter [Oscillospiraceae bacterium]